MTDLILLLPVLASFFLTLFITPFWIRKAKQIGLSWDDMNKISSEKVAGSAGIIAVCGMVFGMLTFIAYRVFYIGSTNYLIEILALLGVILLLTGIGLIDDLFGWRKGGLSRRSRIIMVILAAIPLIVINAGRSSIAVPFLGIVDFGIWYPLLIIPLGIVGAATTFNFIAGYNGLEAGQGIIILFSLSIVSFFMGNSWLTVIALCACASLLAFLLFNFYPARGFPGDTLTYPIGGLIAMLSILGNFEKVALFFFIPYIIEVALKSRGKLLKQSFGKPVEDGSLDLKYDKIYGLEHLSIHLMKKNGIKPTEKRVVFSIWAFQIIIIIIGFLIFKNGIFN